MLDEAVMVADVQSITKRAAAVPLHTGASVEVKAPERTTVSPPVGIELALNVARLHALARFVPF